MKKYQLWLERKQYSQHLFNLIKIQQASKSPSKVPVKQLRHSHGQNFYSPKYKDLDFEVSKLGDLSYAIPYKQLKSKKLRIMRAFDIVNENINLARRIKDVKSAFNVNMEKGLKSEDKRRLFEKKCQNSNEQLREQNFKKFRKWQRVKHTTLVHHYILMVQFQHLDNIIFFNNKNVAFWCQIKLQNSEVKSEVLDSDSKDYSFHFPFENSISESIKLTIYTCKGLVCMKLGQILLQRPALGESLSGNFKTTDDRHQFRLNMSYSKITRQQMPRLILK